MSKNKRKLSMEEKIEIFKKFGVILTTTALISTMGITGAYKIVNDNPYSESVISHLSSRYKKTRSKNFLDEDGFFPTFLKIDNLTEEEQNAYLLYYALISNYKISDDVKKEVKNYIYYVIDNPYLDYGYIYDEFKQIITKKVCGFSDPTILGLYNHDTHTMKYKYLEVSFHELLHSDSKKSIPLWYDEALSALIDDEYNQGKIPYSYGFHKNVLRILCEIIGKEKARNILFICESEGNLNLLKEELYRLNLDGEEVNKLFDDLDEYHNSKISKEFCGTNYLEKKEAEIKQELAHFYEETHKNENVSEYVTNYFVSDNFNINDTKIYYLNSKYMNNTPYEQSYYYPYEEEVYDKIKLLRDKKQIKNFSSYLIYIDGDFYFKLTEEELKLSDIIVPDKVILVAKKYYKDKTITEYMNHEDGKFIVHNTSSSDTNKVILNQLVSGYEQSNISKGGKVNG